jgi:hypothetical protein
MAATATTAEARIALETLVARFAALATKREFAETLEDEQRNSERQIARSPVAPRLQSPRE